MQGKNIPADICFKHIAINDEGRFLWKSLIRIFIFSNIYNKNI